MKTGHYLARYSCTEPDQRPLDDFTISEEDLSHLWEEGIRHVDDINIVKNLSPIEQKLLEQGINAYLIMPFSLQGEIFSSLNICAEKCGSLTEEQVEIARVLADPRAVAIQQSRLSEQLINRSRALEQRVEDLRTSQRYLAMLNEITRAALQSQDLYMML